MQTDAFATGFDIGRDDVDMRMPGVFVPVDQVRLIFKANALHVILGNGLQRFSWQSFTVREVQGDVNGIGLSALIAFGQIG
jgi:hypothetical protein